MQHFRPSMTLPNQPEHLTTGLSARNFRAGADLSSRSLEAKASGVLHVTIRRWLSCYGGIMKRLFPVVLVCLALGCASQPKTWKHTWDPSPAKLQEVFDQIQNPYKDDGLTGFAFATGYLSAYSSGHGSLGALYETPKLFSEKKAEDAYRAGWQAGAMRAFRDDNNFEPVPK